MKLQLKDLKLSTIWKNVVGGFFLMIPFATTLVVVLWLFDKIDSFLPKIIGTVIPVFPKEWVTGLGFILLLIICYFLGAAAKNYFGKMIIQTGNALIASIPLINKVYLGVQQVIDSVAGQKKRLFEQAVLLEYPKKNSYCIGFVTSETTGEIPRKINTDMVSIFVPTTPNPTSGFLLFLPKSEIIELDMSVETAIKTVMSAGVVNTDQIKQTDHMYVIPKQIKNFNWLGVFKKLKKHPRIDPRD